MVIIMGAILVVFFFGGGERELVKFRPNRPMGSGDSTEGSGASMGRVNV